ncbi:hypothetical protein SESBI_48754 [Sesbania bispinosa]|nr:hypothetical protein SESBI_48754 [Sesbania bispinosa]
MVDHSKDPDHKAETNPQQRRRTIPKEVLEMLSSLIVTKEGPVLAATGPGNRCTGKQNSGQGEDVNSTNQSERDTIENSKTLQIDSPPHTVVGNDSHMTKPFPSEPTESRITLAEIDGDLNFRSKT